MSLPPKAIRYILFIMFLAIITTFALTMEFGITDLKALVFWAVLAAITESLGITLPSGMGVSVGFAVSLASIIVGGPLTAAVVSAAGFMLRILKSREKGYAHIFNTPFYKTVFNVSQAIIVAGISGLVYIRVGGTTARFSPVPAFAAVSVYMLLNSTIMAKLISLLNEQSFSNIWISNIKDTLPSSVAVGTIGIIIALAYLSYGSGAVLLFFGPLLLARFSFKLYVDMRNVYMSTIQALNRSMEAKDPYTSGHASRVQDYAVRLAAAMGLPESKIQNIKTAAILHDIGKIGINDNILKKPTELTKLEFEEIRRHPIIGAEILKDVEFLKDVVDIIKHHHERYDGKGYPDALKGNEISIEASILAIADVYDAMTSNRPYRKALDKKEALNEIKLNTGTQFHPEIAAKFLALMSA